MPTPPPIIQYCPSCHKALPNGAAYCPACGNSSSNTKKNPTPLVIGVTVAALFATGAIVFYSLNQPSMSGGTGNGRGGLFTASSPAPTPTPIPWPEDSVPILRVTLDEFGKRYDDNKIFVKTTYGGKFIAIQGQIESIGGDIGSGHLQLRGLSTNAAIYCRFNSRTTPQLAKVRTGAVVVVRGFFMGGEGQAFATDKLDLTDCKLEENP